MEIGEIIKDSFAYPAGNITALLLYVVLGIIAAFALGGTVIGVLLGAKTNQMFATGIVGIVGFIISFIILLLISGYELDIIKYGIRRSPDAPGIDFVRQVTNGIKLIIVTVVYYIVPMIITFVLGLFLRNWILYIIALILYIVFALALFMAQCRLANTDSLGEALSIGEAISDISRVGLGKIIGVAALLLIIFFVVLLILALIAIQKGILGYIGSILIGIFSVYMVFVMARAEGLLYSDI